LLAFASPVSGGILIQTVMTDDLLSSSAARAINYTHKVKVPPYLLSPICPPLTIKESPLLLNGPVPSVKNFLNWNNGWPTPGFPLHCPMGCFPFFPEPPCLRRLTTPPCPSPPPSLFFCLEGGFWFIFFDATSSTRELCWSLHPPLTSPSTSPFSHSHHLELNFN